MLQDSLDAESRLATLLSAYTLCPPVCSPSLLPACSPSLLSAYTLCPPACSPSLLPAYTLCPPACSPSLLQRPQITVVHA